MGHFYSTFFDVIWEIICSSCIDRMILLDILLLSLRFKLIANVVSTTDLVPWRVSLRDNGKSISFFSLTRASYLIKYLITAPFCNSVFSPENMCSLSYYGFESLISVEACSVFEDLCLS